MNGRDAGHRLRVGFGAMFQKARRQFDLILLRRNMQRSVAVLRGESEGSRFNERWGDSR